VLAVINLIRDLLKRRDESDKKKAREARKAELLTECRSGLEKRLTDAQVPKDEVARIVADYSERTAILVLQGE
jgi:hypothetical protein